MSLRLAVLISGSGRSLENLVQQIERGTLGAEIPIVISSNKDAYGLVRAKRSGLCAHTMQRSDFADNASYSAAVFTEIRARSCDYVCLMGFLKLLLIPADFVGKVLNIHPALLPSFGGKGMYGDRVHNAVLAAGVSESGCTVHLCDNEYDHGKILLQRRVRVLPDDDAQTLAARVFEEEKLAYIEVLQGLAGRSRG